MAQATADKTADQKDSWEDYAETTNVSLDSVLDGMEKQVKAGEDWQANMLRLAGRVSSGTLEYLESLGPQGAPLVAKLADASDVEMARFEGLMKRRAAQGVAGVGTALQDGQKVVGDAGKMLGDAFGKQLAASIAAGTDDAVTAAQKVRAAVAAVYAQKITQMIEVKADPNSISYVRQEAAQAARYRP
jgi:hypothetical protein